MAAHGDSLEVTEAGGAVLGGLGSEDLAVTARRPEGEIVDLTAPGRVLGRFVVIETLGRGAMGTVLKAYDGTLDRAVALKLLHVGHGRRQMTRLTREAQALARLSHPHVVQVYEVGTAGEQCFIAMELVSGKTLGVWNKEAHDWRECVEVYVQAGEGLQAAHEAGLVHRDFKPDNCIMDESGRVRVLDFGLVVDRAEQTSTGTHSVDPALVANADTVAPDATKTGMAGNMVVGTPAYMPLEQFEGRPADERSDQFSFCVALYEAAHGERPFAGRSLAELNLALIRDEVRPAPKGSRVPGSLRKALLRGLSSDPAARWPSMRELLTELRRIASPRRRWPVPAAIGGGVLALGVMLWPGEDRPCQGARAQLEGVWGGERRDRVREAILGTEVPYAADTWARIEPMLEDQARAWVEKHVEVCEATAVHQRQSAETLGLRMGCLHRQRTALREAVDVLTEANQTRVERAVDLLSSLPSPEACDDVEALRSGLSPPRDPETAAEVERQRERLRRAQSLQQVGEYDEGSLEADAVVSDAEQLGYPPLLAEALALRGTLRRDAGEYPRAEDDLRRAYVLATESGHDEVAADTASTLTFVVGDLRARHEQGLWWGTTALALSHRLRSDRLEATALQSIGNVLAEQGKHDDALDHLRRSLAAWERARGPGHPDAAHVINDLGAVLWLQGQYDQAREHFERALASRREQLGARHPALAPIVRNIGNVWLAEGQYDQALERFREALSIREDALGATHPQVATSAYTIGVALAERGRYDEALPHFERALAIREQVLESNHPELASSLESIALVEQRRGELDDARPRLERVLAIREQTLGPDHPSVANSLINLGVLEADDGRSDRALELYDRALTIRTTVLGPDHPKLVALINNIGSAHQRRGDADRARASYERALALGEHTLGPSHPNTAVVRAGLATVLRDQGDLDGAQERFERALEDFEKALGPTHAQVALVLWNLATLALQRDELDRARRYGERCLATYRALGEVHVDDVAQTEAWLEALPR